MFLFLPKELELLGLNFVTCLISLKLSLRTLPNTNCDSLIVHYYYLLEKFKDGRSYLQIVALLAILGGALLPSSFQLLVRISKCQSRCKLGSLRLHDPYTHQHLPSVKICNDTLKQVCNFVFLRIFFHFVCFLE